ncbi:MAG: sel1 repeat family protein [Candidatus Peribacteraceae bacterium]|nr:sel1 repeat family protein [Candidatus Peribacteraceae bacterium]
MRHTLPFLLIALSLVACSPNVQADIYEQCDSAIAKWNADEKVTNAQMGACLQVADQGNVQAMLSLGVVYVKGLGVEKNLEKAVEWFAKAALTGNVNGQYNLGLAYAKGNGVTKDLAKAAHYFRLAAEQNDSGAQYNLGVMYAVGEGLQKDPIQAYAWLDIAARNGYEGAAEGRDDVGGQFSAEQLKQVQAIESDVLRKVKMPSSASSAATNATDQSL